MEVAANRADEDGEAEAEDDDDADDRGTTKALLAGMQVAEATSAVRAEWSFIVPVLFRFALSLSLL